MTNDNFREALEINFGDLDIEDKKHLEILMRRRGFITGTTFRKKQNQLDSAWDYLKTLGGVEGEIIYTHTTRYMTGEYIKGRKARVIRDKKGRFVKWIR